MTFPKHALIQFGGTLAELSGPKEVWACGVRVYTGAPAGFWLNDPQAYANKIATPLRTWFQLTANGMVSSASIEWVKVNNIRPDGKYNDATTHQAAITAGNGGNPPIGVPSFCSVATTWETGLTRGLAHRGRVYLPNYMFSATGSQIPSASVDQVVAAGKALLNIINSNTDGTTLVQPIVVSSVGAGATNLITGVSADNVYDVQRRRKNRLTATRNRVAWP